MAQFNLNWINTLVLVNPNATGQRVLYRQKALGGAFISTGFTPANDLAKFVSAAVSPDLDENKIWEFKVQALCTEGGPIDNDNGLEEALAFQCLTPIVGQTFDTSTITLNILGLDITKARFTLRLTSNNSIVFGPIVTLPVGNSISVTATGLTEETSYYWQYELYSTVNGVEIISSSAAQLGAVCGPYTSVTEEEPVEPDLQWIADTTSCEKAGGFGVVKTISGVYSPGAAWYDNIQSRVYIADHDSPLGNVYWFNQVTATTAGDMNYSTAVNSNILYGLAIDDQYRRIYFVGGDSGGLISYNIDTDTASVVPYGADGSFSRIALYVFGNIILCGNSTTGLVTIDRASLTVLNNIPFSGVPNNTRFAIGANGYSSNDTDIYVVAGSGSSVSSVGVYNSSFTSNITNITLPGAALWESGRYWQSSYYDAVSQKLFVGDFGSSTMYVIDTLTNTVVYQATYQNKEGKSNAAFTWAPHPITGELFCMITLLDSSGDTTQIKRSYIQNRTTYQFENMYNGEFFNGLKLITGTDRVVSVDPGNLFWSGVTTPDGSISILSTSVGADNTGIEIVNTLQEVDANNGNLPTGNTKPNTFGDPDYIAPYTDLVSCPATTSTDCPDEVVTTFTGGTLYFEFVVPPSVKNNPAVDKVRVTAYDTDLNAVEGTPTTFTSPTEIYYSGNFTGLTQTNYTIQVEYLNASNTVLNTCNSF